MKLKSATPRATQQRKQMRLGPQRSQTFKELKTPTPKKPPTRTKQYLHPKDKVRQCPKLFCFVAGVQKKRKKKAAFKVVNPRGHRCALKLSCYSYSGIIFTCIYFAGFNFPLFIFQYEAIELFIYLNVSMCVY